RPTAAASSTPEMPPRRHPPSTRHPPARGFARAERGRPPQGPPAGSVSRDAAPAAGNRAPPPVALPSARRPDAPAPPFGKRKRPSAARALVATAAPPRPWLLSWRGGRRLPPPAPLFSRTLLPSPRTKLRAFRRTPLRCRNAAAVPPPGPAAPPPRSRS